ncbi:efflux transporter outer membrane subunit [Spongorhabdus nitratireducens]
MVASCPYARSTRTVCLSILVVALSACSSLSQTEFAQQPPEVVVPVDWQSEKLVANADIESGSELGTELLQLINEPQLQQLVKQALEANYDLRQTALRLQEQQLLLLQSDAARKPKLDLNYSARRNKNQTISNSHELSLDLSWELDVWGRLADASRAAEADVRVQQQDYQAARNSLVARVIQQWIDISLRQQMIHTEQQWIDSLEGSETVILERYRRGLGNLNDLETARAATARIRSSLVARKQQQLDAYRQLALLLGQSSVPVLPEIQQIPDIANPPVDIPATVLARRPDMQSAYQKIVAADARAAVSRKQLLPGFSLTASLSQSRPHLNDLLSGSAAWSLLGRMTAPLFDGGRLKADAEIAELKAERSYLAYQQTLLSALNEVEAALGQESSLAQQQQHLKQALKHSEQSLTYYQSRYREGLSDILDLLNARQTAFDARIQLLQTRQSRLKNRITLGLALGMGV